MKRNNKDVLGFGAKPKQISLSAPKVKRVAGTYSGATKWKADWFAPAKEERRIVRRRRSFVLTSEKMMRNISVIVSRDELIEIVEYLRYQSDPVNMRTLNEFSSIPFTEDQQVKIVNTLKCSGLFSVDGRSVKVDLDGPWPVYDWAFKYRPS